ncbi:protein RETARDED ROOT GROWTH, mitochondrial-like isoform X2 [Cornus florida]|uniref:protein RETARDED ROOT GROWTH, mitochondrial-like isoform X2 n=1 Tax=Cornus florida TaxID=4283 RepID=UPI00289C257C|nr:protein RETARDED ROOT GROWTH, mitochondrial-like isoform X2 [Cornus florida]
MQAENSSNVIPPISRSSNYIDLRFCNFPSEATVDGLVEEFTYINHGMEKTGTFTMDGKKIFQLVGKANSNLADVIPKVGLFERSEIAWRDAKYAQISAKMENM